MYKYPKSMKIKAARSYTTVTGPMVRANFAAIHLLQSTATKGKQTAPKLFEDEWNYVLGDPELDVIGNRDLLAQLRHKNIGPAFYHLGHKIIYHSFDLNAWAEARRVEPKKDGRT